MTITMQLNEQFCLILSLDRLVMMYKELVARDGDERALSMGRAMKELAHGLCQRGESMRSNAVVHPAHLRDMSRVEGHEKGSKSRKDRTLGGDAAAPKKHSGHLSKSAVDCGAEEARVAQTPAHAYK
jgi:hypothetical protein